MFTCMLSVCCQTDRTDDDHSNIDECLPTVYWDPNDPPGKCFKTKKYDIRKSLLHIFLTVVTNNFEAERASVTFWQMQEILGITLLLGSK